MTENSEFSYGGSQISAVSGSKVTESMVWKVGQLLKL